MVMTRLAMSWHVEMDLADPLRGYSESAKNRFGGATMNPQRKVSCSSIAFIAALSMVILICVCVLMKHVFVGDRGRLNNSLEVLSATVPTVYMLKNHVA